MYACSSEMHLFPDIWKLLPMNLHGLMHIWILVAPEQMVPPFQRYKIKGSQIIFQGEKISVIR